MNYLNALQILGLSLLTVALILATFLSLYARQAQKRLRYWRIRLEKHTYVWLVGVDPEVDLIVIVWEPGDLPENVVVKYIDPNLDAVQYAEVRRDRLYPIQ